MLKRHFRSVLFLLLIVGCGKAKQATQQAPATEQLQTVCATADNCFNYQFKDGPRSDGETKLVVHFDGDTRASEFRDGGGKAYFQMHCCGRIVEGTSRWDGGNRLVVEGLELWPGNWDLIIEVGATKAVKNLDVP
jgi:hypothetical protein